MFSFIQKNLILEQQILRSFPKTNGSDQSIHMGNTVVRVSLNTCSIYSAMLPFSSFSAWDQTIKKLQHNTE